MSARPFAAACSFAFAFALVLAAPGRAAADDEPVPEPPPPPEAPTDEPSEPAREPEAAPVHVRVIESDEPPPPPPPRAPSSVIGLRLDSSYGHRRLLELPTNGAEFGLAIGGQGSRSFAVWGGLRGFWGRTVDGLSVESGTFGMDFESVHGRFRMGGGVSFLFVAFGRATAHETITSWGASGDVAARLEIVRSDATALFARAAFDVGAEVHGSFYWGPSLGLGAAFDLTGDRAAVERWH